MKCQSEGVEEQEFIKGTQYLALLFRQKSRDDIRSKECPQEENSSLLTIRKMSVRLEYKVISKKAHATCFFLLYTAYDG